MFPDFHAKSDTRMRELRSAEATGGSIYLIMELCTGGPLLEVPLDFPGLKNDALIADVGVESLSIQPEGEEGCTRRPESGVQRAGYADLSRRLRSSNSANASARSKFPSGSVGLKMS